MEFMDMVARNIFTRNGSAEFKTKVREKQLEIQQENSVEKLIQEQKDLEKVKALMTFYLTLIRDDTEKGIYVMYHNDISKLLTQIENRILESRAQGVKRIKKRKSRMKKGKVRGGRKLTNKRKYTRSRTF